MSDPLASIPNDAPLTDPNDMSDEEARAEAAKVTRVFLLFAGILALCFIILLGALGWKMTHPRTPDSAVASQSHATEASKDAEIAALQARIATLQNQTAQPNPLPPGQASQAQAPVGATTLSPPYYTPDSSSLAQLSARMDRLEADQRALTQATGAAYAARTLQLAAAEGAPFLPELSAAEPSLDNPALAATLRPYAEKGVSSAVTLAVRFPAAAAKANIAARAASGKNSFFDHVRNLLGAFISVRRTDNISGQGTEAILARAENRLNLGDLRGALGYLSALPPAAHDAMKPWLDAAQARLLVDDTTRQISETAMNRLNQLNTGNNAPANGGVL
ncbi:mitofilin family membrane protein [Asticcacaulis sp. EMRT-3]|uniref:COG4223 family protein n=1 Tax=Asticcacaulis sp. EMRT-3 TaxID=3040349 RepID=UPI0024AFE315|nr:mitofilin family membrane protein [Asticcacaulis sp. EMRT-3]MDI7776156.1 mitofilin family membrane protein [Asticcacaulis sp. EMRT-3]